MNADHAKAIEILHELGMSATAIVKDTGWYLDDAPTLREVKSVLACRKGRSSRRAQNRTLTLEGLTKTVTEWADTELVKKRGIKIKTLYERISLGWTDEEVLTQPVRTVNTDYKKRLKNKSCQQ